MNIGIAAPIELASLKEHLPGVSDQDLKLGLGGTAVNILIDGFIKAGHNVTVFTLDRNVKAKYVLQGVNLKIIIGTFRTSVKFKMIDFCKKEYKQIQNFIEEERDNVDIVNAHWSYEFAIGTILSGVPHLITFRDHSQSILRLIKRPYRLSRLLMDLWVRRHGSHFSYNSLYLKTLIKLDGPAIPNPIKDSEITLPRSYPKNDRLLKICFVANGWDFRKNPEMALESFSIVHNVIPNIELHMIGKGFEPKGANYLFALKKGWVKNVVFRGQLAHRDFMIELNDFDIMLHTAREESFGNNLIEAMAKGLPVVAGNSSGAVPWVLDYGNAGVLTDIESSKEISKDLLHLISNHEFYEKLSENGILNLTNRFVQSKVVSYYLEEYSKISKIKL